jgi:hypothetical protein
MRYVIFAAALCLSFFSIAGCSQAQQRTDYCRYGDQSSLFVIDRTTPYDETDRRVLMESAGAVVDELGIGDRLIVITIGAHYSASQQVFNACRPGCPETDNPLGDIVTGCASMIALRDERDFRRRLVQALRPLTTNIVNDRGSDITGTLAHVTQRPPNARPFATVSIFSDMLENSLALSWAQFSGQSEAQSMDVVERYRLLPNVRGAQVRIVGFGRMHDDERTPLPPDLDQRLRDFWSSYFTRGGARSVSFDTRIG